MINIVRPHLISTNECVFKNKKHCNLCPSRLLVRTDFRSGRGTQDNRGGGRPIQLLQPCTSSDQRARWLWQMTCTQWCSNSFTSSLERLFSDHIAPTHIRLHHQPPAGKSFFFFSHRCTGKKKKKLSGNPAS